MGEAKHFSQNDRFVMNRMVHSIFVPVFFANIGLHLDFIRSFNWQLVLLFTVVGITARYVGAYLGTRLAKQDKSNLQTIAICHTAGGEMHIVVAILALSSGLITKNVFVGIVVASIISTIIFGPWLAHAIRQKKKGLLSVVFSQDSIILNADYPNKEELITSTAQLIATRAQVTYETVLEEIGKREEQMSTAMGKGVAFPHARLQEINHPLIFIVKNKTGLEWDSPDDKPVHWVIFIITPESNPSAQLHILQMLAKTLSNKDLLSRIELTDNPHTVWDSFSTYLEKCEECINPL